MPEYTIVEVLQNLKSEGYTEDFSVIKNGIDCKRLNIQMERDEFVIDKYFRFDGMSDPDDESILFAISNTEGTIKGTIVDGYGRNSDPNIQLIYEKLNKR